LPAIKSRLSCLWETGNQDLDICKKKSRVIVKLKMKPMNSRYSNRMQHKTTFSFSNVHPLGGLVTWPDGSTSRIGERRQGHAFVRGGEYKERKGFVQWPAEEAVQARA